MKISEIIGNNKKTVSVVQPRAVAQKSQVAKVMNNIAASDANREPTELEKVLAMRAYSDLQDEADQNYVNNLKTSLVGAKRAVR